MSREHVAILEIVARYCGRTSSMYRYIAQDIAALTASPQAAPEGGEPVDTEGNPVYPIDPGPLWRENKPEGCLTHLRSVDGCYSCDKRIAEWDAAGTCKDSLKVGATDKDSLTVEERILVGDRAIAIVEELRAVLGLPVGDVVDCVAALASPQVQGVEAWGPVDNVLAALQGFARAINDGGDDPLKLSAEMLTTLQRARSPRGPLYAALSGATPQRAPGVTEAMLERLADAAAALDKFGRRDQCRDLMRLHAALASGPIGVDGLTDPGPLLVLPHPLNPPERVEREKDYARGWNDCRNKAGFNEATLRASLAAAPAAQDHQQE